MEQWGKRVTSTDLEKMTKTGRNFMKTEQSFALRDSLRFIRAFASQPSRTGAIAPSSTRLANMIVRNCDFDNASLIVELGPGTGAFTNVILERNVDPAKYFGMELNPYFVRKLRKRYPHATFYHESAEHLVQRINLHNGALSADYVISGLPWAMFPFKMQVAILKNIVRALKPGGTFITFGYVHALPSPHARYFRKLLERFFTTVETSPVVWWNLPPALVFYCVK